MVQHGCREKHGRQGFCLLAEANRLRSPPRFQPMSPAKEVQVSKFSEVRPLGNCLCSSKGMSTTLTVNCNSGISTGFCTVRTVGTCRCTTAGMSSNLVQGLQLESPQAFSSVRSMKPVVAQQRACQATLSKICN